MSKEINRETPKNTNKILRVDYSNFKDTIARTPDQQAKHDAYASVWHTMIDALGGFGQVTKLK